MRMEQMLSHQAKQVQTISPVVYQSLKILQMTSEELEDFIQDSAIENPTLEVEETSDNDYTNSIELIKEHLGRTEASIYSQETQSTNGPYDASRQYDFAESTIVSLRDHLSAQFDLNLTSDDLRLLNLVIDYLDDSGYLTASAGMLGRIGGFDEEYVGYAIKYIQTLDPLGVGAKNLGECLAIQLKRQGYKDPAITRVAEEHLEDIANGNYNKIAKAVGRTTQWVRDACDTIRSLSPKPAAPFGGAPAAPIFADVRVRVDRGRPVAVLERQRYSRLYINDYYLNLSKLEGFEEAAEYLDNKIKQAQWIINAIDSRKQTLLSVATLIAERQSGFFTSNSTLQPFIMRDAALALGIHESTISRAVSGKYLTCERGIFPMKFFFTANAASTEDGYAVSRSHIVKRLGELIGAEDKASPLSDSKIAEALICEGIRISRRAIAKYRLELNIPSTNVRKAAPKPEGAGGARG